MIFGPGDPELAHRDDERISLAELELGRERFAALASIAGLESDEFATRERS